MGFHPAPGKTYTRNSIVITFISFLMLPFSLLPLEFTADLHIFVPAVGYLTFVCLLGVILKRPWARPWTAATALFWCCESAFWFPKSLDSQLKGLGRPAVALVWVIFALMVHSPLIRDEFTRRAQGESHSWFDRVANWRCKVEFRLLLCVLGALLLLPLSLWAGLTAYYDRELPQAIERLQSQGLLKSDFSGEFPRSAESFNGPFRREFAHFRQTRKWDDDFGMFSHLPLEAGDLHSVRSWIRRYEPFLELMPLITGQLDGCTYADLPDWNILPDLSRLNGTKAYLEAHAGRYAEASEALRFQIMLVRSAVREGLHSLYCVRELCTTFENIHLIDALDDSNLKNELLSAIDNSIAYYLASRRWSPQDVIVIEEEPSWTYRWRVKRRAVRYADEYVQGIKFLRQEYWEVSESDRRTDRYRRVEYELRFMTEIRARMAMCRAACRILAGGAYPDALDLKNPFTGDPMIYRRLDPGFEIECPNPTDKAIRLRICR
jgi:hypothetical protein